MAIFDFNLTQYFEGYRYIAVMAKYLRTKNRQTRVKVASELNIPITTYRRLEEDKNFRNEAIIKKVANHFNLEMKVDYEFISKINDDFNEFYNSTYFGDIEYQEKMYTKLMLNFDS
ncbi:MAG TPA: helix-turn-helix transcriptional regulator, partial [Acholeplasmataceae bacterium]|nr:helix-turn-helix transcriptional regulator [Acholeplasmataceae bacterium]